MTYGIIFLISNYARDLLIIPIEIARKYGIDKPSNVVVQEKENGILIRKLEV